MSHDPDASPSQVGPYRLQELLGRGGMGEVFAATDSRLERRVAVKHVRDDSGPDADRRFRREIKTVARLSHPGIVQIFDVVDDGSGVWVVMELVDGPTLAECLRQGPLAPSTAVAYARQIAAGIVAAHEQGVVHRDLKTENVMVSRSGHVKILDFGLAKRLSSPSTAELSTLDESLTAQGALVGTVRCMSPEQARGFPLDHRSDLFSFGVLVYEMCAGISPFHRAHSEPGQVQTPIDTLTRILTHRQTPLSELRPDMPVALSELVDHLLAKAPEQRPASMKAVLARLDELATGSGSGVPPLDDQETEIGPTAELRAVPPGAGPEPMEPDRPQPGRSQSTAPSNRLPTGTLWALPLALVLALALLWSYGPTRPADRSSGPGDDDASTQLESPRESADATGKHAGKSAGRNLDGMDVAELYRFGVERLQRPDKDGRLDAAVDAFQRALDQNPDHAGSLAGLARAYAEQHLAGHQEELWLKQGNALADRAVELDEHLTAAHAAAGLVAALQYRYDDAWAAFDRGLALSPGDGELLFLKGRALLWQGDEAAAESLLQDAVEAGYEDRQVFDTLGTLYFRLNRHQDAAQQFRRAVAAAPDSHISLRNLSAALYSIGDLPQAAAVLQKALAIRPSRTLYSNLGTFLFAQARYSEAAKAYEKALGIDGGGRLADHWANLGDAYRFIPARQDEAREAFTQAAALWRRKLETEDRDPWRTRLVLILAKLGQAEQATTERSRLRDPDALEGRDWYRLAVASEILGRRAAALDDLGRAMELGFSRDEIEADPELVELRSDPELIKLWNRPRPAP